VNSCPTRKEPLKRLRIGFPHLKGVIALFEGQHEEDNLIKGSLVFSLRSGREGTGQNS